MKISIITINLNNSQGLQQTLDSVFCQSDKNFEVIVIDGSSKDDSLEVIRQYQDNISYWISEPDSGIYNAMNKGIYKANGDYCFFLNSGDWLYHDNVIEEVIKSSLDADIICGNALFEKSYIHEEKIVDAPHHLSASDLILGFIPHQATLIKRSLFYELGFYDENYIISSDWSFFINALIVHNKSFKKINTIVSRCDRTGISSRNENIDLMDQEQKSIVRNLLPYFYSELFELKSKRELLNSFDYVLFEKLRSTQLFWFIRGLYKIYHKSNFNYIKGGIKKKYIRFLTKQEDSHRKRVINSNINVLPSNLLEKQYSGSTKLIVSLTSHGKRVSNSVQYTIYSIFRQTVLPDKIVLFLNKKEWNINNLPLVLKKLQLSGLEIVFCEDIGPHTKLIPALKLFPNDIIITIDDDIIYNENILKELFDEYNLSDKKTVICHKALLPSKSLGKYDYYSKWKDANTYGTPFSNLSPLGVGGVLYPPQIFDNEIFNEVRFRELSPIADDLWFWTMELYSKIKVKLVSKSSFSFDYVDKSEQIDINSDALHFQNCTLGKNDIQLRNLVEYYKLESK